MNQHGRGERMVYLELHLSNTRTVDSVDADKRCRLRWREKVAKGCGL